MRADALRRLRARCVLKQGKGLAFGKHLHKSQERKTSFMEYRGGRREERRNRIIDGPGHLATSFHKPSRF